MKEIILSDESINSYGFRVLTQGIDLEQYKKNPIMLFMHNRPLREYKDVQLPIGKIVNLRIDGDKLIGTPEFDMSDDFAATIARKYENGFLNMASIGIDILETSQEAEELLVGQTRPTVTKCKLREVSIVDLGSNDNALVIDNEVELKAGSYVELTAHSYTSIQEIKKTEKMKINLNVEKILELLSLAADATQEQVEDRINILNKKAEQTETLLKEAELKRQQETDTLINNAINEGKISNDKAALFVSIAEKNGNEVLKETFACMASAVRPTDLINNNTTVEKEVTWDEADKAGTLYDIKKNNPEQFARMFKAKFNK